MNAHSYNSRAGMANHAIRLGSNDKYKRSAAMDYNILYDKRLNRKLKVHNQTIKGIKSPQPEIC